MALSLDDFPVGHVLDFSRDVGVSFQDFIDSLNVGEDGEIRLTDQTLLGMAGTWRLCERQTNPDVTIDDALKESIPTLTRALEALVGDDNDDETDNPL